MGKIIKTKSEIEAENFDKIAKKQVKTFKIIYEILYAAQHNRYKKRSWAENDLNQRDFRELYVDIINKAAREKKSRTAGAWKLAITHYQDFTSNNIDLVNRMVDYITGCTWFSGLSFHKQTYKEAIEKRIKEELDKLPKVEEAPSYSTSLSINNA